MTATGAPCTGTMPPPRKAGCPALRNWASHPPSTTFPEPPPAAFHGKTETLHFAFDARARRTIREYTRAHHQRPRAPRRVFPGQLDDDGQHGRAAERPSRRAIGLHQVPAGRQPPGAVEHLDVVEPHEAAGEEVIALDVLAMHPRRFSRNTS